MKTFHFCALSQSNPPDLEYYDGIVSMSSFPSTEQAYKDLKAVIRDKFNVGTEPQKIILLSLSLIGSDNGT